jgi:hypothetical protein
MNILITMIGGMPGGDSESHWIKFIKNAEETNPGRLHICIHPMNQNIRQDLLNKWQQYFLPKNKNNFMVCDNDHWVETKWGTISLSFATLMAIQYALYKNNFNNDYYKKIIFIQQGAPLYRFEVISQILNESNKSWFKTRDGEYPGWQYGQPYNSNREYNNSIVKQADIGDWNWFSAIFALDKSHINIFFNNGVKTWRKEGTYSCFGKNYSNIKTDDLTKQNFISQVTGNWDNNIFNVKTSCINSDETFFGVAFKSYFDGDTINENVEYVNERKLTENIRSNYFNKNESKTIHYLLHTGISTYKLSDLVNEIKKFTKFGDTDIPNNSFNKFNSKIYSSKQLKNKYLIYMPRVIWWRDMVNITSDSKYPIYNGIDVQFNPDDLKFFYTKKNDKILHKGKEINVKGLNESQILQIMQNGGNSSTIEINNPDLFDHYTNSKKFTPLTYHDWSSFSLLPGNILRGSNISGINGNTKSEDLYKFLKKRSTKEFVDVLKGNPKLRGIGNKRVTYHPVEYGTVLLKDIVNTFNLLVKNKWWEYSEDDEKIFYYSGNDRSSGSTIKNKWLNDQSETNWEQQNEFRLFTIALFLYETIILKFRDWIKIDNGFIIITDPNIEEVEVGTPVTPDILSSAITVGSLFIRKVIDGSRISNYTDQLFKLNKNPNKISDRENLEGKEYILAPNIFDKKKENTYYFNGYMFNKDKAIVNGVNKELKRIPRYMQPKKYKNKLREEAKKVDRKKGNERIAKYKNKYLKYKKKYLQLKSKSNI